MYNRFSPVGVPGLWWLVGLVCIVVLVVGVAWLLAIALRGSRHNPSQPWQPPYAGAPPVYPAQPGAVPPAPMRPAPHDILRERLARGEITIEEYQRTAAVLGPDPFAPQQPAHPQQQPPQPPQA
jgi:Short C-terminal domain